MTAPDLGVLLSSFRHVAFRLETLDHYTVPQEAEWFAAWQRDGSLPQLTPDNDSWLKLVAKAAATGKRVQRVHLVSTPLSDYLRFELAMYRSSVVAGEDIRIAHRDCHPEVTRMRTDFWLFDEETCVRLHYDKTGHFMGVEAARELTSYRAMRDLTLAHARVLDDYLAEINQRS